MNTEATKILKESMLEEIPMRKDGITVDANAHRIQQSRNLKSAILLLLETKQKLDVHTEDNKKSFKIINNVGTGLAVVFSVAIIGIVAGWTLATILAFFGTVIKGASMFFGKT